MVWLKQYALYLKAGAAVVVLGLIAWGAMSAYGWAYENGKRDAQLACNVAKLELAEAAIADLRAERAKSEATAEKLAAAGKTYEQDKADAQAKYDRDIAAYRDGTQRLRHEWASCETARVSSAATGTGQPDGGADERGRLAAEIVRIGAIADAQIRGLQEVVKADRE